MILDNETLQKFYNLREKRKQEILSSSDCLKISGTAYFVSADGDDSADGLTEKTAWRTLERVSNEEFKAGDGVFFRRGDTFRGVVWTKSGVSYGAYGTGDKPKFFGWDKNLADEKLWEEFDSEHHIWKLTDKILDPGTLVFDDDRLHSIKLIPSYIHGRFVCREDETRLFDMRQEMVRDLDIYWHYEGSFTTAPSKGEVYPVPDLDLDSFGELYLRSDKGNPGSVFSSIEAVTRRPMFGVAREDVKIDNVCIKYVGMHGISGGGRCVSGLHVTNCEIGWIGGTIQHYLGTDPNFPEGKRGTVTRYGNAVEIYGGCDDYEVSNCYIYQSYDAGVTHQISTEGEKHTLTNIVYNDNLIEDCVYGIEYFLNMTEGDTESYMDNVQMCRNIIWNSSYGWGQQRHNTNTGAHIKGWSYENKASNFYIKDNIFGPSGFRMLHLVAKEEESCPKMSGNTYIQNSGGMIGQFGANKISEPDILIFDESAEEKIKNVFGDKDAKVYTI
ncbi:MAG: hypothetical protein IKL94_03080 [Clostridia bacterium]|nr:hypothetical protein [Clostridia bacterium]